MKTYKYPAKEKWSSLIQRPYIDNPEVKKSVEKIITDILQNGDNSLIQLTQTFDAPNLENIIVDKQEIKEAQNKVSSELKKAIQLAKSNIQKYHTSQIVPESKVETVKGVICWRKNVAIEKVGLYIPGGSAPLFSTVLMLGIPAILAGCKEITICTPPAEDGSIHPAILYTAHLLGIDTIYKVGGAQAIAAMALGTATIAKVDKIYGPGNQYVTEAKAQLQSKGIAIDMPAGPSELLIIADKDAIPSFIAADLLSQAEHGIDSQVILVTNERAIVAAVNIELDNQLDNLPRKKISQQALNKSKMILLQDIDTCIQYSNLYAPEHLIIATNNADIQAKKIINAGSVFLGKYSCESAGDYASGTNHTLPTNGYARSYSGISVDSFVKKITFQNINKEGLQNIGPSIEVMAQAEGLIAHKNAVTIRLNRIKNGE